MSCWARPPLERGRELLRTCRAAPEMSEFAPFRRQHRILSIPPAREGFWGVGGCELRPGNSCQPAASLWGTEGHVTHQSVPPRRAASSIFLGSPAPAVSARDCRAHGGHGVLTPFRCIPESSAGLSRPQKSCLDMGDCKNGLCPEAEHHAKDEYCPEARHHPGAKHHPVVRHRHEAEYHLGAKYCPGAERHPGAEHHLELSITLEQSAAPGLSITLGPSITPEPSTSPGLAEADKPRPCLSAVPDGVLHMPDLQVPFEAPAAASPSSLPQRR